MEKKPCNHVEAEINGKRDPRIEGIHDCAYVDWRNKKIPIAERNAHDRVRREGFDPNASIGRGPVMFGAFFHEEMNKLCDQQKKGAQ